MNVPLLDLHAQHASLGGEVERALARVVESCRFIGGPEVAAFESEFAAYCNAAHCVGCSSGTDAIALALRAAGVGRGDEVITTAMTFIGTVEGIIDAGAHPVLVDPDPDTSLLTVEAVAEAITPRTAAIVAVHLYGQPVDLDGFRALADTHKLLLVEDAAQAHGAAWRGKRAGSVGDVAAFSFYPGKNLGALGDAGAVVTQSEELADRVRSLSDHGAKDKYWHLQLGGTVRLDALQAAVLRAKLPSLDAWNEGRRAHAVRYDAALAELDGIDPIAVSEEATSVYHQYVVRLDDRDLAAKRLAELGVGTGMHYPVPLNRQPALDGIVAGDSYPAADRLAETVLSLPVYPEMSEAQFETVIDGLRSHARESMPMS